MVEIRAKVSFERPIQYFDDGVLNLDNFFVGAWTDFKEKYDFKEISPLLMDFRCDVSEEDLLSLIGNTHQEAIERLEKRFPTLKKKKFLQGRNVSKFYEELKINTIKNVTLCIIEF